MAQGYGTDDLGDLSKTSNSTLELADSYLKLGGQAYKTGTLELDTAVSGIGGSQGDLGYYAYTSFHEGDETTPKNVTVNTFIKINE